MLCRAARREALVLPSKVIGPCSWSAAPRSAGRRRTKDLRTFMCEWLGQQNSSFRSGDRVGGMGWPAVV